ncbi:MAG TPA: hypothetical protein RMF84_09745 [Polyangiaceae bacterium LLY-WYZ-14_1]|nr:hypothetical protein [Polyangiaceae bacterium LLY-WYZ-14_1]
MARILRLGLLGGLTGLVWLASPLPRARAGAFEDFRAAQEAFEAERYEQAARAFEALVGGEEPAIDDRVLIQESRKYLGVTYLYLGRPEAADQQFRRLLREDPAYPPLDPQTWPPAVISAFETSRSRLREETVAEEAARRAAAQARREALETQTAAYIAALEAQAAEEVRVRRNSRWIAAIPFGVGQFQNGHDGLGWALLLSESALAVTSATFGYLHRELDPQDALERNATPSSFERVERIYRLTNWIATATLGVLILVGIVDAQLRFVPERREVAPRALPPDPRGARPGEAERAPADVPPGRPPTGGARYLDPGEDAGPTLELGPGGLGLRF